MSDDYTIEELVGNCSDTFHDLVRQAKGYGIDGWEVPVFDSSLSELARRAKKCDTLVAEHEAWKADGLAIEALLLDGCITVDERRLFALDFYTAHRDAEEVLQGDS